MTMSFRPDQVSLRIGISPWAASRSGVERVAEAALSAGIDTFWLGDGLLGRSDFPAWSGGLESFGELAWLAGRYPGASVALGAAVLPLRDPLWVAKSAATLDQLTQGRFTLVLTPGNWPEEFAAMGRDFGGRGDALESGLWSLREIWSADAGDGGPSPRPWSPGGPPVWLAGARATMLRAIRLGLPFQASRIGPSALAPTAREWFDRGGTKLAVRVRMGVEGSGPGAGSSPPTATDTGALVGSAAFLAEQVGAFRQLGVTDLSIMPGQDVEASLRTIAALAEQALPALAP
jgi:alkanesulfonate monooxygenase SsuD/methylene tetrahydromethanopterin reductase-like flavin-dependent oxidoreductase (luciferase family)